MAWPDTCGHVRACGASRWQCPARGLSLLWRQVPAGPFWLRQARAGRGLLYAVTPSRLPDVRSRLMRAHLCGFRCLRVGAPRRCAVFPPGNAGFLAFLLMWFLPGAAV